MPQLQWFTSQLGTQGSYLGNVVLGDEGSESPINRSFSLYIRGIDTPDSNFDSSDTPLPMYLLGHLEELLEMTMYMGISPTASMSMFIAVAPPNEHTDTLLLSVTGATTDEIIAGLPMVTYSDDDLSRDAEMNLFMKGVATGEDATSMNLFVGGCNPDAASNLTLFLMNDTQDATGGLSLYVGGDGLFPGSMAEDASMNLVLSRDPAASLTMVLRGPGEEFDVDSAPTLYVCGAYAHTDDIAMSVPDVHDVATATLTLYSHGF